MTNTDPTTTTTISTATSTPLKAIHSFCRACVGGARLEVTRCTAGKGDSEPCPLFPYRLGKRPKRKARTDDNTREGRRLTPAKAIRAECLHCMGGSHKEVRDCPCHPGHPDRRVTACPLYAYRFGKKPA